MAAFFSIDKEIRWNKIKCSNIICAGIFFKNKYLIARLLPSKEQYSKFAPLIVIWNVHFLAISQDYFVIKEDSIIGCTKDKKVTTHGAIDK